MDQEGQYSMYTGALLVSMDEPHCQNLNCFVDFYRLSGGTEGGGVGEGGLPEPRGFSRLFIASYRRFLGPEQLRMSNGFGTLFEK